MQDHRLYRGQPKDKAIVPSGLRTDCIEYMEGELYQLGIDIQIYKQKCILGKIPQQYCQCTKYAFYGYWLSLVNCAVAVNQNPICFKFCNSPFFTKNIDKDKAGIYGLSNARIADECFNYAKAFFDSDNVTETLRNLYILHDYAFFQHFNHALSRLDKSGRNKVLFPTLALDWTWDYCIAKKFAGEEGNILSISYEAYEKWNLLKNFVMAKLSSQAAKTPMFGFCTYRDTTSWEDTKTDWDSWDNNLMIEQKGAVIFWPWNHTIDDLKTSDLGKAFDFRLDR
jgi:hypothetical protein